MKNDKSKKNEVIFYTKKMLVWDYYESEAIERLVIAETPIWKYIYVVEGDEDNFYNNKEFRVNNITHAKELLQTV